MAGCEHEYVRVRLHLSMGKIHRWHNLLCNLARFELCKCEKAKNLTCSHALKPFFKTSTRSMCACALLLPCSLNGATNARKCKKILQTQFWISAHIFVDIFLSNWLRLFTTPWPKCTLRQRIPPVWYPHTRTQTFIKFCTWLCSIFPVAFLRFCLVRYSRSLHSAFLARASLLLCFFVVVIVLHFSCVCRLDRIAFLQQFYRCDVILNQISMKKKFRYDMLPFAIPYQHDSHSAHKHTYTYRASSAPSSSLRFFIVFILTLHEHNFQRCFRAFAV